MDERERAAERAAQQDPEDRSARQATSAAQARHQPPPYGVPPCPRCGRYDTMWTGLNVLGNSVTAGRGPVTAQWSFGSPLPGVPVRRVAIVPYLCVADGCVAYGSTRVGPDGGSAPPAAALLPARDAAVVMTGNLAATPQCDSWNPWRGREHRCVLPLGHPRQHRGQSSQGGERRVLLWLDSATVSARGCARHGDGGLDGVGACVLPRLHAPYDGAWGLEWLQRGCLRATHAEASRAVRTRGAVGGRCEAWALYGSFWTRCQLPAGHAGRPHLAQRWPAWTQSRLMWEGTGHGARDVTPAPACGRRVDSEEGCLLEAGHEPQDFEGADDLVVGGCLPAFFPHEWTRDDDVVRGVTRPEDDAVDALRFAQEGSAARASAAPDPEQCSSWGVVHAGGLSRQHRCVLGVGHAGRHLTDCPWAPSRALFAWDEGDGLARRQRSCRLLAESGGAGGTGGGCLLGPGHEPIVDGAPTPPGTRRAGSGCLISRYPRQWRPAWEQP